MKFAYQQIACPVGQLVATWSDNGLYALNFRSASTKLAISASQIPLPHDSRLLEKIIANYFKTGRIEWPVEELDWHSVSPFQRRVLELCYAIPSGQTRTYGELAALADSPQAARAVGAVMASNRWPLIIPCHRVVGSNGKLTGYSGGEGTCTKRWLLDHESSHCELVAS